MATNVAPPMPPANSDLATTWNFLEEGLDRIMTQQESLSSSNYSTLYSVVCNYCTSSRKRGGLGGRAGAKVMGGDLYPNLTQYFIAHLKTMRKQSDGLVDEALLTFCANEWVRYTSGAKYIDRIFAFFNRHFVKHERDEGQKNVHTVYNLALLQWQEHFVLYVDSEQNKLAGALFKLIEQERDGKTIDQNLVKKVADSFVFLGTDEADAASLNLYKDHFETPFIGATEKYYKQESEAFLAENSLSDYLKRAEERLKEEEDRLERYVNTNTRKKVIQRCEHVLIREHAEIMWDDFQRLLDTDQSEDLQRMCTLLSRVPRGLEPVRKKFAEHPRKAELAAVAKLLGPGGAAKI